MEKCLDKIKIDGFKSIKSLELELRPLNILVGANGAGKSNFISFFDMLNHIVQESLQLFVGVSGGAEELLYYGQDVSYYIMFGLLFGRNSYIATFIPTKSDGLVFEKEIASDHRSNNSSIQNSREGHKETFLNERKDKVSIVVRDAIKEWKVYHFQDTRPESKMRKTNRTDDNNLLNTDASNLASYLYLLKEKFPDHFKNITKKIRLVAPFFERFILEPEKVNPDTIKLKWREKDSVKIFGASAISDGTLRFMCLATLLLQPEEFLPSTIIIDEPELGLHPYAIYLLAGMLKSASKKRQVVVSTQSVTLINHFEPEDIITVERQGKESVFKRQSSEELEEWVGEYAMGELWEKNVIGGRP